MQEYVLWRRRDESLGQCMVVTSLFYNSGRHLAYHVRASRTLNVFGYKIAVGQHLTNDALKALLLSRTQTGKKLRIGRF